MSPNPEGSLPAPHEVYPLVLRGVIEEVILSKNSHGGVQSAQLLVAHTWHVRARGTPPVDLPGGRTLRSPCAGALLPRVTHYSVALVPDRLGPLNGFLDPGLQGLVIDLWGIPTGGRFQGGKDVVIVRDARVSLASPDEP